MAVGKLSTELILVVEAAGLSLFRERHEIGWLLQVPVLMRPELATAGDPSVHLINDQVDAHLLGHLAQLIRVETRDVMIATS